MNRSLLFAPILLVLGALAMPALQGQTPAGTGKGQGQQLRKRDGSCATPGQGQGQGRGKRQGRAQGVRKQDGTGPRAGTAACPKTPAPAK